MAVLLPLKVCIFTLSKSSQNIKFLSPNLVKVLKSLIRTLRRIQLVSKKDNLFYLAKVQKQLGLLKH